MKAEKIVIDGLLNLDKRAWDKALSCLTNAFSEDPCFKYLLQSDVYDKEKARFIHEYTLKYGCQNGNVLVTSENIEGVCVWLPPKTNNHSSFMHVWNYIVCGGLKMDKRVNPGTIDTLRKYGTFSGKLHHKYAKGPHWYLMSVGVAKEFQGQGFAKKLILPMLKYFDEKGLSCYLETHNPQNVKFYERFGFTVMEVAKLPGSDKNHWAMLREPKII